MLWHVKKNTFQLKFDSAGNNFSLFTRHMSFQIFLLLARCLGFRVSPPRGIDQSCSKLVWTMSGEQLLFLALQCCVMFLQRNVVYCRECKAVVRTL